MSVFPYNNSYFYELSDLREIKTELIFSLVLHAE
jgi:hypothetical protein